MRTTILALAATVIVFALLAACRTRDEPVADSTDDSARGDGTATDSGASAPDTVAASPIAPQRKNSRRTRTSDISRVEESPRDSMLPPEDSIRAMRPDLPQVTPEKRPRTWRGFKLPEERPVRVPLEPIRSTEQRPDSTPPDSTSPPKPKR